MNLGLSDKKFLKFFESFPSYKVQVSDLIKLINNEKIESVIFLVSQKKELQKEEILYIILSLGIKNPIISGLAIESKSILTRVSKLIESRSTESDYIQLMDQKKI